MPKQHLKKPASLIATLGTEPQVVTAVLDLLLIKGQPIQRVIVVHSVSPDTSIARAVEALKHEFTSQGYPERAHLVLHPLVDSSGQAFSDVETPEAVEAAFRALYRIVLAEKKEGANIHLSIAGGRKSMAVFGMAVAQMLFDEDDHLWHLYSAGEFLESRRLHPQEGDDVHLVPIPVIHWSRISPAWLLLDRVEDPFEAVRRIHQLQLQEKVEQASRFVNDLLSPAEREVTGLLVRAGLSDIEIAGRLDRSPRTVERHLRSAYRKAAAHWNLPDVNRAGLVGLLSLYYALT